MSQQPEPTLLRCTLRETTTCLLQPMFDQEDATTASQQAQLLKRWIARDLTPATSVTLLSSNVQLDRRFTDAQYCKCHPDVIRVEYKQLGSWKRSEIVAIEVTESEEEMENESLQEDRRTWWKPFGRVESLYCFFSCPIDQDTHDEKAFGSGMTRYLSVPVVPPRDKSVAIEDDNSEQHNDNDTAEDEYAIATQWVNLCYGYYGADIPSDRQHEVSMIMQSKLKRQTMLWSDHEQFLPLYSILSSLTADIEFQQAFAHIKWMYHPFANDDDPLITFKPQIDFSGNGRRLHSSTISPIKTTSRRRLRRHRGHNVIDAESNNNRDDNNSNNNNNNDENNDVVDPDYRVKTLLLSPVCKGESPPNRDVHESMCFLGTPSKRLRSQSPSLLEMTLVPDSSAHHIPDHHNETCISSSTRSNTFDGITKHLRSNRKRRSGYSDDNGFVVSDDDDDHDIQVADEPIINFFPEKADVPISSVNVSASASGNMHVPLNMMNTTTDANAIEEPEDPFATDVTLSRKNNDYAMRFEQTTEFLPLRNTTTLERFQQFIMTDVQFMFQCDYWRHDLLPILTTLADCNNNLLEVWPLLWQTRFNLLSLRETFGMRNWGDRAVCFFCKKKQTFTHQLTDPGTGNVYPAGSVCSRAIVSTTSIMRTVRHICERVRHEFDVRQLQLHAVSANNRVELSRRYERPLIQLHEWESYLTEMQEAIHRAQALRATAERAAL